jgi:hypothetical protein
MQPSLKEMQAFIPIDKGSMPLCYLKLALKFMAFINGNKRRREGTTF